VHFSPSTLRFALGAHFPRKARRGRDGRKAIEALFQNGGPDVFSGMIFSAEKSEIALFVVTDIEEWPIIAKNVSAGKRRRIFGNIEWKHAPPFQSMISRRGDDICGSFREAEL
jgi:hypothetical protein